MMDARGNRVGSMRHGGARRYRIHRFDDSLGNSVKIYVFRERGAVELKRRLFKEWINKQSDT